MKITSILNKENIIFELKATTKAEVIDELITTLSDNRQLKDIKKLKEAVLEREEVLSSRHWKRISNSSLPYKSC